MIDSNNRINNLDALKFVCSFLIVCIHVPFIWDNGIYISLTRIAVPAFFMITGFFYQQTVKRKHVKKQIVHILSLIFWSNIFYFLEKFFFSFLKHNTRMYIKGFLCLENLKNLLLFNESPFEMHLWYLNALLYVLIFVRLFYKIGIINKIVYCVPILLTVDLIFGKYSLLTFNKEFNILYVRNFLFVGLPYFLLGYYIDTTKDHIYKLSNTKYSIIIYSLIPLFIISTILERNFLMIYEYNVTRDHYISTTILVSIIFISAILLPDLEYNNLLVKFGRKYSSFIYVIHLAVKDFLAILIGKIHLKGYMYFRPIIVFLTSLISAILFYWIYDKICIKITNRNNTINNENICDKIKKYKKLKSDSETNNLPELYNKKENCCGCSACYATCPVKAILMEQDDEGFLYPVIDVIKCIKCYKCTTVCAFKKDQNSQYLIK